MEKFSTSLRGYNKEEVNKFVDDCIVKVDSMLNQLKQKDLEIEALKHDLVQYKNMEATFNKAILVAEDASNQIKRMARDESSRLIDDAKKNASRIVNNALLEAEKTQRETEQLRRNIITFKRRLKTILENQLDLVDDINHIEL